MKTIRDLQSFIGIVMHMMACVQSFRALLFTDDPIVAGNQMHWAIFMGVLALLMRKEAQ